MLSLTFIQTLAKRRIPVDDSKFHRTRLSWNIDSKATYIPRLSSTPGDQLYVDVK